MAKRPGGPVVRRNTVDAEAEYKALLRVFKGGWITMRLAEQLLGARGKHATHSPEVLEATRRAWLKYGVRYMAERKQRREELPRVECKCDEPCNCYMAKWKRDCELGPFGGYPWALSTFGPPRGMTWEDCGGKPMTEEERHAAVIAEMDRGEFIAEPRALAGASASPASDVRNRGVN